MLDPRAVNEFKARKLRNSDLAKDFTARALQSKLDKLEPPPKFELKPFEHQMACFLLCLKYPHYFLCLDMGLGKTMIMISLFRYLRRIMESERMLVLVPYSTNIPTWGKEIYKFAPRLEYDLLDSRMSSKQKYEAFWGEADIVVMTYAGLRSMIPAKKNLKSKSKLTRWILDSKTLNTLPDYFDMVVCDESTAFKNHRSLAFQTMKAVGRTMPRLYNLSGTPFSTHAQDLWAQFFVLDQGDTLGQTLGLFRAAFFREVATPWSTEYKLKKHEEKNLHRTLRHSSIRYEETECQDLPPVVGGIDNLAIREIHQTREQYRFSEMFDDAVKASRTTGENIEAIYYKMRCLSSGYIPTDSGFKDFKENPKIEELLSIIEEAGGQKLFVYMHHHHTIQLVRDALKKKKITTAQLHGKISNKAAQLDRFEKKAQVLLASSAAAYGLNLQFCHRTVFFESPDDIASRRQVEKRTHRHGQQASTVFFYDLAVHNTVDFKILKSLKEGKRVLDVVIDGVSL